MKKSHRLSKDGDSLASTTLLTHVVFNFQRQNAKDLLKHRFIKAAKKTSILVELIDKHRRWKELHGDNDDSDEESTM